VCVPVVKEEFVIVAVKDGCSKNVYIVRKNECHSHGSTFIFDGFVYSIR